MSITSGINRSVQGSSDFSSVDRRHRSSILFNETGQVNPLDNESSSPTPYEQNVLDTLVLNFVSDSMSDSAKLTGALRLAFGDKASDAQISQLASQIVSGDAPLPTSVEFVNAGTLGANVSGVYIAENGGRILLDGSLLNDPLKLRRVFTEELGHHFDAVLGGVDAAGDEGAIFAESLQNGAIGSARLNTLRNEDDSGVIAINGRTVAVEQYYGGTSVSSNGSSYLGTIPRADGSSMLSFSPSFASEPIYTGPGSSPGTGGLASAESAELGLGSQGTQVGQLQRQLTELGYDTGSADSDFGPRTATALSRYQRDRIESIQNTLSNGPPPAARAVLSAQLTQLRAEADRGVAGEMTQEQIVQSLATQRDRETAVEPQPAVDPADADVAQVQPSQLGIGDGGAEVRSLQRDLQRAGYSPGTADADFGQRTLSAVQDFQLDRIADHNELLNTPGLPSYAGQSIIVARNNLQAELDAQVAGPATRAELDSAIAVNIPGDLPVNGNLQVNSDGFIINDPNIVQNRVPQIEQGTFNDSIGDIEHVVLHRTVTDTTEQTLDSFATPRTANGTHFGTHFLVGRDGAILQTASLDRITYHVAGSNSETIGIEVVGNPLDADGNVTLGPPNGTPVSSWEPLTPEQVEAVAYLTNSLNQYYGLGSDTVAIHEDLAAKTEGEGGTVYDAVAPYLIP